MIIGLCGTIAAGKGAILDHLKSRGFKNLTFSDEIREEARKRNIEISRENLQMLGTEMRTNHGRGILAKKLLEKVNEGENVIVDGVRNVAEIEELRKRKDFFLISIDAPQKLRFHRILERKKDNDLGTWEEFIKRDDVDNGIIGDEKGQQNFKCMELSDFAIYNDSDIGTLSERINEIMKDIQSLSGK
ncbi:MAG: AAA family ATPase [Nanoarchaeota archaeon]|nr:AAA family ATPase [Nanoarchaeota archaeon]